MPETGISVEEATRNVKKLISYRSLAGVVGISHSEVYRRVNPEAEVRKTERVRSTRLFTTLNGKTKSYKVKKRPRPLACEICGREPKKRLYWHHWDDEHLERGIWCCGGCHIGAEFFDNEKALKYQGLKNKYNIVYSE